MNIAGQQDENNKNKRFSIAAAYAPVATFYYPGVTDNTKYKNTNEGLTEITYSNGINLRADYMFTEKLSLSSGFNYKVRKRDFYGSSTGMFAYNETSESNKFIYEIPLYLNYRILKSHGIFEPYVSAGLRFSLFKWDHVGSYTRNYLGTTESGFINDHKNKALVYAELGSGTYVNISKSFSLLIEANITCTTSYYGFLEIASGVRYSF